MSANRYWVTLLCSTAIVSVHLHAAYGANDDTSALWGPGARRVAALGELTKRSLQAEGTLSREPSLAEQFAEADAEALHAKDAGEKERLEKKRDEVGHRWLDGLAANFEAALAQRDSTEARLIVTSVFDLMKEHASLAPERGRFESLLLKAWLRRYKGIEGARVEKRIAAMLLWLDDKLEPGEKELKATHIGAAIEDYGFGRAYILLFGD